MTVETLHGSRIMTGFAATPAAVADAGVAGGRVRYWSETVEVSAGASATSTYRLARLPGHARIVGLSTLYHDDLASTGSPTVDLGLVNPDGLGGITDDDDALAADIDVTTAGSTALVGDVADRGKPLWSFVAAQAEDPRQELEVVATLKDAAANVGGTLTLELFFTID
jgi:hypothetical protein